MNWAVTIAASAIHRFLSCSWTLIGHSNRCLIPRSSLTTMGRATLIPNEPPDSRNRASAAGPPEGAGRQHGVPAGPRRDGDQGARDRGARAGRLLALPLQRARDPQREGADEPGDDRRLAQRR